MDRIPAPTNTHQWISTLYGKSWSHLYIAHQATGTANNIDMITSFRKSFDNNLVILATDAPSTFRTPISLIRFSAIYVANPNNPRQEIKMVSPANRHASV